MDHLTLFYNLKLATDHFTGDKSNHVASLHVAQMLYIWPYFMFFSWPIIGPNILRRMLPQNLLPIALRSRSAKSHLPRPIIALPIMAVMLITVRYNTLVHPFTLADNRHYMFYVFRLLLRHRLTKYAVVPVYFTCAWTVLTTLGDTGADRTAESAELKKPAEEGKKSNDPLTSTPNHTRGARVSFTLVWLVATTLSLVTAPLVEPRYFIIPWITWRLHVPVPPSPSMIRSSESGSHNDKFTARPRKNLMSMLWERKCHLWLETLWFGVINLVTFYVFLHKGFKWPQDPDKIQRFMW